MLKPILGLALLAAGAAPLAAMASDDDFITMLLGKADEPYAKEGYKPTGWSQRGALPKGQEARFTVALSGATDFQLVGVCDSDCDDLDIQLLDSTGKEVDEDDKKDDFPIVGAPAAGTYTARVTMAACSSSACAFGLKAYVKK